MSKNPTQTIFASASNPSSSDELLGKLAAYRPIETEEVETTRGPCEATITQVVEITEAGDLGERPVFWQVVRRQLATATEEVPWVVGRLALAGRAFRLEAITDSEAPAVRRALAQAPLLRLPSGPDHPLGSVQAGSPSTPEGLPCLPSGEPHRVSPARPATTGCARPHEKPGSGPSKRCPGCGPRT